jgi:uncharacterized protein (TIGR02466 family)
MENHSHNLFSVQVNHCKAFLPETLAHNIRDYILTYKSNKITHHNNLIGNARTLFSHGLSTYFLQEVVQNVSGCAELEDDIIKCVNNFMQNNIYSRNIALGSSWFNIQHPGSTLTRHVHPGSIISGALYINADQDSSPIFFENPNPYYPFCNDIIRAHEFLPTTGDLILFPSWLSHYSDRINRTDNRIVISFNTCEIN